MSPTHPVQQWSTAVATTALIAAGLVASASPGLAVEPSGPTSAISFAGYTDKEDLRTAGRTVVANEELPVTDGAAPIGTGVTYFIDSASGDDAADGRSEATAWKSFAKINTTTLSPGDRVLLKAGSTWSADGSEMATEAYDYTTWSNGTPTDVTSEAPTALLAPKGSGTAENPIIVSSYGTGAAPELNGRGVVNDVLQLTNQQHWDISNLEISNMTEGLDPTTFEPLANNGQVPGEENPLTGDLRGIHVSGESAGTLQGYDIHNVFVRDVSGTTWSVSGSGLDRSKRTGGIMFEGLKGDSVTPTQFEDVSVRDNFVSNTSFANLTFKQFAGMGNNRYQNLPPGWGDRAAGSTAPDGTLKEDPSWRPHTNIDISGNYMTNRNTQYGWDSMYLTSIQGATVEDNMIDGAGVSGIEMYYSDNVVVQNNEVAELAVRRGAADSNGIDPDRGTSNILIQANYVHDSGEGILLCGFGFSTAVVRYNIIQDIERNYINPHGVTGANVVYNNLMYNTVEPLKNKIVGFFESSGSATSFLSAKNPHHIINNVFINAREDVNGAMFRTDYPGVSFSNNAYHGPKVTAPAADANAITGDPKLGGNPAESINNVLPTSGDSPLITAGVEVDLNALMPGFDATGNSSTSQLPVTTDIFNRPLTTPPSIGPASYVPAEGKGLITGAVIDQDGEPFPGGTVSYGTESIPVNTQGRFAVEVAAGEYDLVASAPGFADGTTVPITIPAGATLSQNLSLGQTTATTGTLTGTITAADAGLADATITVSKESQPATTTTTDNAGVFTISNLAAGDGYTVSVTKDGYEPSSIPNVTIRAARTVTVDLVLSEEIGETIYAINESFNDESSGTFTGTNDGTLVSTSDSTAGTVTVTEDEAREGNKYLRISKTGSGNLAVHNADEQNLTGTVTIESRIQRSTTNGAPNQVALYSFTEQNWNAATPASSANPAATLGLASGRIITHNVPSSGTVKSVQDYAVGQWYTVRNVVNLDTGTFDFYVDDMTTPKLEDQPLRTAVDDLDYFSLFSSGSNRGDMLVDYLRVNTGAPFDTDDASLRSLTATSAEGSIDLSPSVDGLRYSGTVDPLTETVSVGAIAGSSFANVTINGIDVTDGSTTDIDLTEGTQDDTEFLTEVPVIVTAENGTTATYTLAISRTNPNQSTQLRGLIVEGYELSPAFEPGRQGEDVPYVIEQEIDPSTTALNLSWDLGWAGQRVQVNGETLPEGATQAVVNLADGENTIEVTTNSYPGDFGSYVIKATRPAATAAVPEAPTGTSATAASESARVTWAAPASDGGAPVTGYTVTAAPGGATCTTTETTCVVPGLTNGKAYTFTVTATNEAGTSTSSEPNQPVTPGWKPGTEGRVAITVSAKATCSVDGGQLAVHVTNKESAKVDLRITIPYGEIKIANVKAGESVHRILPVPVGDIPAGTGTVAAYLKPGGKTHYSEMQVGWSAIRCS